MILEVSTFLLVVGGYGSETFRATFSIPLNRHPAHEILVLADDGNADGRGFPLDHHRHNFSLCGKYFLPMEDFSGILSGVGSVPQI